MKSLTNSNKQLTAKLDEDSFEFKKHARNLNCEMDELKMKLGKKELQITQADCENKVLK